MIYPLNGTHRNNYNHPIFRLLFIYLFINLIIQTNLQLHVIQLILRT